MDCVFCKIVAGEIPADIVYEDEEIIAFHDLSPQAPVHVLVIPRVHIESLEDTDNSTSQRDMFGHLMSRIKEIANIAGLKNGYRLVCNCGEDGMQTVNHLHFHLIGGRTMGWPPG